LILGLLVACGDNALPCDYAEHDDVGNGTTAEASNVTAGDHAVRLCGAIDSGSGDPLLGSIDDDSYRVSVATPGPMLVNIYGADGVELLDEMSVRFFDTAANPRLLGEGHFDPALAGHGAFIITLDAGDYDLVVSARAHGTLSVPLDYRIRLAPMPACDAVTAPTDYTEAKDADANGNTGNDVVDVDFSASPSFTMSTTASVPEPTGLAIAAGEHYLIEGGASADARADEYLDRDTYELTTDDTTNELAIRLDWDSDGTDLDYILFEKDVMTPVVTANTTSTTRRELAMFAVKPSTTYWLWIGDFKGSQPSVYHATVCGNHFFF